MNQLTQTQLIRFLLVLFLNGLPSFSLLCTKIRIILPKEQWGG